MRKAGPRLLVALTSLLSLVALSGGCSRGSAAYDVGSVIHVVKVPTATEAANEGTPKDEPHEAREGYIWVAGHYAENPDRTWSWKPGFWLRAQAGRIWVHGFMAKNGERHVWIEGHWAIASAPSRTAQASSTVSVPPPVADGRQ